MNVGAAAATRFLSVRMMVFMMAFFSNKKRGCHAGRVDQKCPVEMTQHGSSLVPDTALPCLRCRQHRPPGQAPASYRPAKHLYFLYQPANMLVGCV
jgi:hypothetical protein